MTRDAHTSDDFSRIFLSHSGKLVDKWSSYLPVYDRVLSPYKEMPVSLLEIGIQNGGSLEIWGKYFESAQIIIGCDIDKNCRKLKFENPAIKVIIGAINSESAINEIKGLSTEFDIIIDDGSHKSAEVIDSFLQLFPLLRDGGVYIAEDLHTSYWKGYGGQLKGKKASMEFFKALVDVMNYEHWEKGTAVNDHLHDFIQPNHGVLSAEVLAHVHEISFFNSMCVITKMPASENVLGVRNILGNEQPVTFNAMAHVGREIGLNERVPSYGLIYEIKAFISRLLGRS